MRRLTCAQARDRASDLLDGELSPGLAEELARHVAICPTCPALYRALIQLHRELRAIRAVGGPPAAG